MKLTFLGRTPSPGVSQDQHRGVPPHTSILSLRPYSLPQDRLPSLSAPSGAQVLSRLPFADAEAATWSLRSTIVEPLPSAYSPLLLRLLYLFNVAERFTLDPPGDIPGIAETDKQLVRMHDAVKEAVREIEGLNFDQRAEVFRVVGEMLMELKSRGRMKWVWPRSAPEDGHDDGLGDCQPFWCKARRDARGSEPGETIKKRIERARRSLGAGLNPLSG